VPDNLPTVSVVIPARDAAESLAVTLAAIARQTYANVVDVVVAAADEPTAATARAGGATVVENPAGTTPAGLNLAIGASSGEIIVRCDAHAIFPPHYVEAAVTTLLAQRAVNVGGSQVPVGQTPWECAIAEAMMSRWGAGDAKHRVGGDAGPAETVYLGVFRRDAIAAVGGFDEGFERTQDYELNHRLIEAGGTVWFDPGLRVGYRPRGSLRALARQYYDYGRAKRQFNRKHPGSLLLRQVAPPILVVAITLALMASILWPAALLLPAVYVLSILAASLGRRAPLWRVASALVVMHVSWGFGFLTG